MGWILTYPKCSVEKDQKSLHQTLGCYCLKAFSHLVFFLLFCCTIFSVCFWLFYSLKQTMHLCKLWPNLNYCRLFSVTIDKNWKDIKHVSAFTVTFLMNIDQQIFPWNAHLARMIRSKKTTAYLFVTKIRFLLGFINRWKTTKDKDTQLNIP